MPRKWWRHGSMRCALLATIGIDFGLLPLAIVNPPREPPSMRPSGMLRRQMNEAIDTAIARAGVDREWVRRHFVHHNKSSYLVIPNLYSCDPNNKEEAAKALAVNQLAGVLSDLELVRWPKRGARWLWLRSELEQLKREESFGSDTDLTEIRQAWQKKPAAPPRTAMISCATPSPCAITACFPRRSGLCRSPAGASGPATISRSFAWWTPRV